MLVKRQNGIWLNLIAITLKHTNERKRRRIESHTGAIRWCVWVCKASIRNTLKHRCCEFMDLHKCNHTLVTSLLPIHWDSTSQTQTYCDCVCALFFVCASSSLSNYHPTGLLFIVSILKRLRIKHRNTNTSSCRYFINIPKIEFDTFLS